MEVPIIMIEALIKEIENTTTKDYFKVEYPDINESFRFNRYWNYFKMRNPRKTRDEIDEMAKYAVDYEQIKCAANALDVCVSNIKHILKR